MRTLARSIVRSQKSVRGFSRHSQDEALAVPLPVKLTPSASIKLVQPLTSSSKKHVVDMINTRPPFQSLPQQFYTSDEVFDADVQYLWRASWLFAGYALQIPKPGDFFTYEVGPDSVIIVRDDSNNVQAFHNTCRHRGSRICSPTHTKGYVRRIVCPYHQWSYGRDGKLLYARDMGKEFNKDDHGLRKAEIREISGMLFVCLGVPGAKAPHFNFAPASELIEPQIGPHELSRAKIAHTASYTVPANWKLVYENNRECYHCPAGHPEYIKSNYDTAFFYDENGDRRLDVHHPRAKEIESHIEERTKSWQKLGFECTPNNSFPGEGWYRASRQPLRKGWVTESIDGKPVGPLMGRLPERDMGSLRIHTLPNFWIHVSSDHGVSARLTPIAPTITEVKVDWLVHEDAVEGKDYTLEKLLPFWQKTSEQDWDLCAMNQLGVQSSHYTPGPLSSPKEKGVEKFTTWYLHNLKSIILKGQ